MPKINISGNEEERIFTEELIVAKNVLIYDKSFIPLYNISAVSVVEEEKESYHIWALVMCAIGIVIDVIALARAVDVRMDSEIAIWFMAGVVLITLAIFDFGATNERNEKAGEYMVLSLNSGRSVFFYSRKHAFIMKVMDVIINCINKGDECVINLERCNIRECQFGDGNIMTGR